MDNQQTPKQTPQAPRVTLDENASAEQGTRGSSPADGNPFIDWLERARQLFLDWLEHANWLANASYLAQVLAITGAAIGFWLYGYRSNLLNLERDSTKFPKVTANIDAQPICIHGHPCRQQNPVCPTAEGTCTFRVEASYEITNRSKTTLELSYLRFYFFLLDPEDVAEQFELARLRGEVMTIIPFFDREQTQNVGDWDLVGWTKIYDQDYVNYARCKELKKQRPEWRQAAITPSKTTNLPPEFTKKLNLEIMLEAKPGAYLGTRIYLETNHGQDGHRHRFVNHFAQLEPDAAQK